MKRRAYIPSQKKRRRKGMKKGKIRIEVIDGVEGACLSINGYRFAGPKPWGGGKVIRLWVVDQKDFIESLKHINISVA